MATQVSASSYIHPEPRCSKRDRTVENSAVTDYLRLISKHDVLDPDTQIVESRKIRLWEDWQKNNPPETGQPIPNKIRLEGERALERMTRTNLRLVIKVARRYEGLGLELMDLIQEGNLGLIRGLRDFDPARGYRISTYVFWWIRQSILKALDEKSRAVRVPERFGEIGRKSVSIIDAWYDKHGVVPTANEVATELRALGGSFANLTTARYTGMMETLHTTTTTHLMDEVWDNIMCQNDGTVAAEAEDEVDKYYSKQLLTLAQAMVCLNDQEQYLVRACCIDHAKVDDVADALGVKKSRVQQIQSSAIKKLRLYLGLDAATASLKR